MSEEKQIIEEMANDICKVTDYCYGACGECDIVRLAERLYNAGYRKQSEVIDEFVDRLKEAPIKLSLPLLGLTTKSEIEEHFNGIMLQVRDAIDGIAKQMKGGAE